MRSASGSRRMSLLTLALQLSFVDSPHFVDRGDLIYRFIVANVSDAREAKCVSRFVAGGLLDPVEGNLQNDRRLDRVYRSVARDRCRLKVLGQSFDLRVGQPGVRLA